MGPNERKLIIKKFTQDAIPANGNVTDGVKALMDAEMPAKMKEAALFIKEALDILMGVPYNPYRDREEAAEVILRKI